MDLRWPSSMRRQGIAVSVGDEALFWIWIGALLAQTSMAGGFAAVWKTFLMSPPCPATIFSMIDMT
jgi:hypothetical protein